MENSVNERVVTLGELWEILKRHWRIMILAALVCVGCLFVVKQVVFKPRYQSTATLYILRQDDEEDSNTADDFSLALKVVNDCDYLLKSHSVLDQVIEQLGLDVSYKELSRAVSTSNPEDTRILEVIARADTPEDAKRIVDAVCEVGTEKIAKAMGSQQVNLFEYGTVDKVPCNRASPVFYGLATVIAAIMTYVVFFIRFLVGGTVKAEEDIQHAVSFVFPGGTADADGTGKKRYGGKYGCGDRRQKSRPAKRSCVRAKRSAKDSMYGGFFHTGDI